MIDRLSLIITMRPDIMGRLVLPNPLWVMGWPATAVMAVAVAMTLVSALSQS